MSVILLTIKTNEWARENFAAIVKFWNKGGVKISASEYSLLYTTNESSKSLKAQNSRATY